MSNRLAVILLRGLLNLSPMQKRTLQQLKLRRKHQCVVVPKNPSYEGMLQVVKDFVTWGEISDDTYNELVNKRSDIYLGEMEDKKINLKNKFIKINGKVIRPVFRLSPPRKGFERKGIRRSVQQGGAAGYRGDKINNLLQRMI